MGTFNTLPATPTDGTLIDDVWLEEYVIDNLKALAEMTAGGVTLFAGATSKEIGWTVGDIKTSFRILDISNKWLRCDGRTIGNTSSGATARANADMYTLYAHLWDNSSNTWLVIQNSSGVGTTRGATALDDFNANKRLPLPDFRGRSEIGMDDPTGSSAAGVNTNSYADALGGTGGAQVHTLTVAEMPGHSHSGTFSGSNNFAVLGGVGAASGSGYSNDSIGSTGGGGSHNNVPPVIAVNRFIYCGN